MSCLTWKLLKTIPSRIYNYKNFDLAKSNYATVGSKRKSEFKDLYGNINKSYCLELKLRDARKIIKKYVSYDKYKELNVGSKIMVASFDNYNTYVVEI